MNEATKTALIETGDREGRERPTDATPEPISESDRADLREAAGPERATPPVSGAAKRRRTFVWFAISLAIAFGGIAYFKRHAILERIRAGAAPPSQTTPPGSSLKVLYWVDAMNPTHRYDKPGKAPDGMDLVPVYDESGGAAKGMPGGAFKISPEQQQLIGVTYGESKVETVARTIRAVGRLTYDETRIARVHTKIEGWIDKVFVDYTGKLVKKGEPLITIYSPDLVQTQQEYLLALKGKHELEESDFAEVGASAQSLYESSKQRLQLWDVSDEQIKEIEKRGVPKKDLTIYSPVDGFVMSRNAYPEQRVTPDAELYTIGDLSTIWVIADVYEYEAQGIHAGQSAVVTLSYLPDRKFTGKVSYVYPEVDNTTRTLKVRVEVPNPDFTLKPDMYANVDLSVDYGRHVVVPEEAVLDSGSSQTVFVALGGGYFEPRAVKLGESANGMAIVLEGLKPGEKVVTSGNFLVDSESKLKSAMGGMGTPATSGGEGGKAPPRPDHSNHKGGEPSQSSAGGRTMTMPDGSKMVMPERSSKQSGEAAGHSARPAPAKSEDKKKPGGTTMVMPDGSTMVMPEEHPKQSGRGSRREEAPGDARGRLGR